MRELHHTELARRLNEALLYRGALLSTRSKEGKPNVMTIGWAFLGDAWNRPILIAMVRGSRYTNRLIEQTREFTVSIPRPDTMQEALQFCGSRSGTGTDKYLKAKLTPAPAQVVSAPIVGECDLHVECRVLLQQPLTGDRMDKSISYSYRAGDYHTQFFGEIVACYSTEEG